MFIRQPCNAVTQFAPTFKYIICRFSHATVCQLIIKPNKPVRHIHCNVVCSLLALYVSRTHASMCAEASGMLLIILGAIRATFCPTFSSSQTTSVIYVRGTTVLNANEYIILNNIIASTSAIKCLYFSFDLRQNPTWAHPSKYMKLKRLFEKYEIRPRWRRSATKVCFLEKVTAGDDLQNSGLPVDFHRKAT